MRALLFFILLSVTLPFAKAQQPFTRDLWLNESNTPVKVNDMLPDARGYVWLATEAGLYSFNGRSFVQHGARIQKSFTALAMVQGTLWAATADGGLYYLYKDTLQPAPVVHGASASAIASMRGLGGGMLWLATEGEGIKLLLQNRLLAFNTTHGLSDDFVYGVCPAAGNTLLAYTDKGINSIRLQQGKMETMAITTANGLPDNIVRVLRPMPETQSYWVGMQQGGIAFYTDATAKVTVPAIAGGWQWGQVNDILPMDGKRAWIATEEGYLLEARIINDSLSITALQLPGKKIYKLHCGRSGMLWCATNQGITMATAEYMGYIPMQKPYNISSLTAMAADADNTLWFSQAGTLYRMPLSANTPQVAATLPVDIKSLFADEQRRIWIGSLGEGLWLRNTDGQMRTITGIPQLEKETVLDISGSYDKVWVSGLNGVEELSYPGMYTQEVKLVKHHDKRTGTGSDYVYQVYPDRQNRVWMATDGAGVTMYNNGVYRQWDTTDGMPAKVAYTIAQDARRNIWVATLDNGLCRYNDNGWQQFGRAQGLQDINIATIAANATGQLVAVHTKGIDVWYPNSNQFRSYTRRQAFGIDTLSDVLKLYAKDKAGNVYIPFEEGFIVFKNVESHYDIRPQVNINAITAAFKPVADGHNDFSYDENYFSFRYEGINYANPEHLHYRYRLQGYNDNWTVTNDEAATFPQLPDGSYTFRVQASLNSLFDNASEASYTFTIQKPYWKKAWFIAGMLLLLLAIIYIYMRVREHNLRKVSQLQGERMKFEYEHLKSQVNPHFLFNSLNTLTSLIDENADAAMTYTSRLSDLYRNMLAYRDRDLVLLAEEWEILDNYLYIQKTRFGDALQLVHHIPDTVMATRKIVPLALQLLVENAIKHNVVSRSKPLTITIRAEGDELTISNPIQPKYSKEKGAGLGLINIRKRYSLLSKKSITFGEDNAHYIVKLPLL